MSADVSAQRYFAQALPWQDKAWRQLTEQFLHQQLPHGLLAAGPKGIGKHEFVWRFVAYLLCMQPTEAGACQACDSCKWLKASTHPDLMLLPEPAEGESVRDSIKIDDIRRLQEYSQTKGHGAKVMVLNGADTLTLGAANALLKTLEEPRDGVFLILISDHPSRLLPTSIVPFLWVWHLHPILALLWRSWWRIHAASLMLAKSQPQCFIMS